MAHSLPLPHLHLDQDLVGARHCYDAWRESLRAVYDVMPLSDMAAGMESIDAWLAGGMIFTDVTFSKQSFRHDRRHAENADYLSLQIYRKGKVAGVLGDTTWAMTPGDIHLFDFSRDFHSIAEASSVAGVVIPHHAIGYDPARHPGHLSYTQDSPAGQFLGKAFFALLSLMPDLPRSEADTLAGGFCALLQAIIAPAALTEPRVAMHRARRHEAIRSYLERNLSNPDLDADHVCGVFNMSRSSLYRDFAEIGGVAQYITARRLDRAFGQLRSVPPLNGYVKEIAEQYGFTDTGHFSRLFRRRFGLSPTAAMKANTGYAGADAPLSQPQDARGGTVLNNWFASIRAATDTLEPRSLDRFMPAGGTGPEGPQSGESTVGR